ncbi:HAD-IIIA family hydrolase [Neobacillus sp. YIM B06451]|uniref:D-glycero-alpha-D-manno-heptose-1,7-bisphosphate 7-phosphatase n=1 Tax=Neobacillus sp. YIM B06451 TaxID=3070994 RepID=UPI00292DD8F0|nr:HAD-IIIA family hydrolase [Neobacillus sp. YIM B06451]
MIGVFLDRDGTIGGHGGGIHPADFTLYDFSVKAIKLLNDWEVKVFLFTNQSWIGMGKFTENDLIEGFNTINQSLAKEKATLDGIYYCPHKSTDNCECRKPNPTLLIRAKKEYNLDLNKCYVVGDRLADIYSAKNVGAKGILVETGRGVKSLQEMHSKGIDLKIDFLAKDVLTATHWILKDIDS